MAVYILESQEEFVVLLGAAQFQLEFGRAAGIRHGKVVVQLCSRNATVYAAPAELIDGGYEEEADAAVVAQEMATTEEALDEEEAVAAAMGSDDSTSGGSSPSSKLQEIQHYFSIGSHVQAISLLERLVCLTPSSKSSSSNSKAEAWQIFFSSAQMLLQYIQHECTSGGREGELQHQDEKFFWLAIRALVRAVNSLLINGGGGARGVERNDGRYALTMACCAQLLQLTRFRSPDAYQFAKTEATLSASSCLSQQGVGVEWLERLEKAKYDMSVLP